MLNFANLEKLIEEHAGNMALEASIALQMRLSGIGTGEHYIQNPNRSSQEGEYPSHQTNDLNNSIGFGQSSYNEFFFGPIHNAPSYTEDLHAMRPFMQMVMDDIDLHDEVMKAAEGHVGNIADIP